MSGGKGGGQVIGYKYYLGVDFSWCHAPVDRCTAFYLDNREIYRGCFLDGSIEIDKPELFGELEGGIKGTVDLEIGGESQVANTYLSNTIDGDVPAYRGITRTVFRGSSEDGSGRACYVGNNPYLKRISGEFQRIYKRIVDGAVADQWQKEIAGVPLIDEDTRGLEVVSGEIQDQSIFIQMDLSSASNGFSGRNGDITGNGMVISTAKQGLINSLLDIRDKLTSASAGSLDIGIGYYRFTEGSQNNSSNNPSNVDPFEAPVPNYLGKGGAYDLPKRGWIMKEAATDSDIDDLIAFVEDFVVVPDTVGQFPIEDRELMSLVYDNASEAFASLSTSKLRGIILYSALVTDETDTTISQIGQDINNLLATNSGGDQPIKSLYAPNVTQYNTTYLDTVNDTIGTGGNGSAQAAVVLTQPVGGTIGGSGGSWRYDDAWYLIDAIPSGATGPWHAAYTTGNPATVGDATATSNPAGSSVQTLFTGAPPENAQTALLGPLFESGIYAGNFDVEEHWQRDETGVTEIFLERGGVEYTWAPFNDPDDRFTVDGSDNGLEQDEGAASLWLEGVCGGYVEMNPAHIIRECLTDQQWGLGLPEADVDETSFAAAAQTLYDERFGLSIAWQRETPIEDFVNTILNHIDAVLYVDRTDGLWHLVLIRDDYDPDALDEYTDADVVDWANVSIKSPAELVNSVTVKYNNRELRGEASLTVHNLAQRQKLEKTISTTVNYPGIWQDTLAARVAQRDLITLSTSLIGGTSLRCPQALSVVKSYSLVRHMILPPVMCSS